MGETTQYETCIFEKRDDGIAVVTLNRPEVLNALNEKLFVELVSCWETVNNDPSIRVAIVTGAGDKAFCAGKDMKEYVARTGPDGFHGVDDPASPAYAGPGNHYPLKKPLIGAINGLAVAGGLELFFLCDLRIMAEHAWVGTYAQRRNLAPPPYLYHYLPNAIANWVQLTAGRLDAQSCLRWGIVNEVVPSKDVMPTALKYAREVLEIDRLAPDAIAKTKEGHVEFQRSVDVVYDTEELRKEAGGQPRRRPPREVEGQRAFVEKRQPEYANLGAEGQTPHG